MIKFVSGATIAACTALPVLLATPVPAHAQWSTVYEQTYLPASHNWEFRQRFAFADRLFNAFDYGHAILYETLLTRPQADADLLERRIFDHLTREVLINPPHVPLAEAAVMPQYAKLVPEAERMFDWAHVLHRQTYDVWADVRIPLEEKDARIAEILEYYKSRPDIAFSSRPKSMELMDGQYYSLAFRHEFPRFNGLIWGYHWLQVGLYEPLIAGQNPDERQSLAQATVARFWQLLQSPPESTPYLMPMTAAVAPLFTARYPEIAIIFDNLHMMHDVVSDILASPQVPRDRKRAEIMRAVDLFRDDSSYVTSVEEWRSMAVGMGIQNQGGAAVGFLAALPTPTVERGASMATMEHGPAASHADHQAPADASPTAGIPGAGGMEHEMRGAMETILQILEDPAVLEAIRSDPALLERWTDGEVQAHFESMREMLDGSAEPAPDVEPTAPAHQH
ncbi:MAG: hypothetical protein WD766_07535 [Gemmatimonadota bacterium]